MNTTNHQDILQFHNTFSVKSAWLDPGRIDQQVVEFRQELITEECVRETIPAFEKFHSAPTIENLVDLADGLVDTVYVVLGAVVALELPWDELWNEVHRSNMTKVWPDGTVHRREDGKILKPPDFSPPDLHSILHRWQADRVASTDQPIKRDSPVSDAERERLVNQWKATGVHPTVRWNPMLAAYVQIDAPAEIPSALIPTVTQQDAESPPADQLP